MNYEVAVAQQSAGIASFAPLMAFIGLMFVAFWVWTVRYALWGVPDWMKSRKRPKGGMLSDWFVGYWYWFIRPLELLAIKTKLSPNAVSAGGFLLTVLGAIELYRGDFAWGGWLIVLGGTLDILDGVVARATNQTTQSGAFFDSTLDRYSDMVVFAGLVAYWRESWLVFVPVLAMGGSFMVSYTRAKAESLGIKCDHIGMFQRGERVFVLGVACALAPFVATASEPTALRPVFHLALGATALLAVLGNESALRRFIYVFRQLDARDAAERTPKTGESKDVPPANAVVAAPLLAGATATAPPMAPDALPPPAELGGGRRVATRPIEVPAA